MSRELIGNLILAAILASRGHVAVILNQEDAFVLAKGSVSGTTVFHTKSLHYAARRITQHEKLRKAGFLLTSLDQESIVLNPATSAFLSERYCEENLALAARVYVWSRLEAVELARLFPDFSEKIVALGSPRVDSWSDRFRSLGGAPDKVRKQILLTPSVVMNSSVRHWDRMAVAKTISKSGVLGGEELKRTTMEYHHGLLSQIFFSKLALRLADALPGCDVVIQPKKSEIQESWVKSLFAFDGTGNGSRPNLYVEYLRFLEESIHQSDAVVNSNSTAGLTALVGGIPLISFGPSESIASQLGAQADTVEKAVALVREALDNPGNFMKGYSVSNLELLADRVFISESPLSAERIVSDLETLDSGEKSKLTFRDLLLYLHPGSLRRTLHWLYSAIRLIRPVLPNPDVVTTVSQARVSDLVGRIVEGLGLEQKLQVKVAGGRNIFVTAK